ncbi:AAA family ATPase [Micromonospora sp. STR1_7]|uniref:AAA family ATPase n=1 Tax=Micromonospora parastrephiae TaxID=2806101 RepID=A0ABS1XR33_9ACTN|nr:AAA family ATPase [Micromonospora parastrephiae]
MRNARRRVGMTQRQLAEISTISVRAIRDLELERTRTPRIQTIRLLADALRLSKARRAELEAAAGPLAGEPLIDKVIAPPAPLGPIIGREREVTTLTDMLESNGHRLVNVVGMPGIGKTRVIHEVADALHQSGRMPAICVEAGGSPPNGEAPVGPRHTLIGRIADRLGCEPVLDDVVAVLAKSDILVTVDGRDLDQDDEQALRLLLHRAPGLRVLYETCEIPPTLGDPIFSVFPLAIPDSCDGGDADFARYPAVEFLRSCAVQLFPATGTNSDVTAAIACISWHLDGIPRALEAAASWLLLYEPAQLLDTAAGPPVTLATALVNTDNSLIDWLDRTMAALPVKDAEALRRLVEADPWTVEQAVDLLGGPAAGALRAIRKLRTLGLVRRIDATDGAPPRFRVLNLVRHALRTGAVLSQRQPPRGVPEPLCLPGL